MRKLIYILLVVTLLICPSEAKSQDKDRDAQFQIGVEAFKLGDFNKALEEWLSLYNTGYVSAELTYNIANTYFKMNNIPNAILFYERALLLSPANEDINYNLQVARTKVVDRFEEIPDIFFVRWYNYLSLMWSTNTWAVISLVTFVVCLIMILLYLFTSVYRYKVIGFWTGIVMLFVSIVSLSCSIRNHSLIYDNHFAIILDPQVSGKSSPIYSGTDLFVIHEGSKVELLDQIGDWCEIRLSDGNKGWIQLSSFEVI